MVFSSRVVKWLWEGLEWSKLVNIYMLGMHQYSSISVYQYIHILFLTTVMTVSICYTSHLLLATFSILYAVLPCDTTGRSC
jgi:hypothetical protein